MNRSASASSMELTGSLILLQRMSGSLFAKVAEKPVEAAA